MDQFSHHAYLVEGPLALVPLVATHARNLFGFPEEHSPDVVVQAFEKLGVDEAAQVRDMAALKSSAGKSLYIIGFSMIMSEAQQSLLKLLEEPQEGVVFILVAPHGTLLPTLRSRLLLFSGVEQQPDRQNGLAEQSEENRGPFGGLVVAKQFLTASSKDRSAQIAALLKEEGGERERVRGFLQGLEALLYAALPKAKDKKPILEGLSDIAKIRSYVGDRSPSLKMLLEHLAVSLPKF